MDKGFVVIDGALRNMVMRDVEARPILSEQELDLIEQAEKEITKILQAPDLRCNDYSKFTEVERNGIIAHQVQLKKDGMKYLQFMAGKASKLLQSSKFIEAEGLFDVAYKHACDLLTPHHVETMGIELDLIIARYHQNQDLHYQNLEKILEKLNKKLAAGTTSNDTKRSIAIADYVLAQYHSSKGNFDKAMHHLNRSEALRLDYGASDKDKDKIRYLKARIIFERNQRDSFDTAIDYLHDCYHYRMKGNELNPALIPVIELLLLLVGGIGEKAMLLGHLLSIQKSMRFDNFKILDTQLHLLKTMVNLTSEEEWYEMLEALEKRFNEIPRIRESPEIGLCYLAFSDVRMSTFTPLEWPYIRKQKYYEETFRLIVKAQSILQGTGALTDDRIKKIKHLSQYCKQTIEEYGDPTQFLLKGSSLHPEDEAAIMSASQEILDSTTVGELELLSNFSSDVDYTLIDPNENILNIQEFDDLPAEGLINPYRLRVAQGGINSEFRDGKSLNDMKTKLIDNPDYANQIPSIEIGVHDKRVFSFDTRRLIVHQQAREVNPQVLVRYKKISGDYLNERIERIYTERAWNGLVTALRYGGKNSESEPYINPSFRKQLESKVDKQFKRFPNDRKYADSNGFPTVKKQARKLHDFLVEKVQEGSDFSRVILNEATRILKSNGENEAYEYLIRQKNQGFASEQSQQHVIQLLELRTQKRIESIIASEQQNERKE